MSKFKVGDRVRATNGVFLGEIATVTKETTGTSTRVKFDNGTKIYKNTDYLELVEDSEKQSAIERDIEDWNEYMHGDRLKPKWRCIDGKMERVGYRSGDLEADPTPSLKDSGDRREFETGAVRDMAKGKGRCDLLPIKSFSWLLGYKEGKVMANIEAFKRSGSSEDLKRAIKNLAESRDYDPNYGISECGFDLDRSVASMILDVSLQFEAGAEKYGEGNWQKGIPTNVYIDSAVRHYLKHLRGDTDEPHLRATTWNLLCCLWTVENKPELNTYVREYLKQKEEDL